MESLTLLYASKKEDIQEKLKEFEQIWQNSDDQKIFSELAFCLCTPQSRALAADLAIRRTIDANVLFNGKPEDIEPYLTRSGVRFFKNKSKYIVEARNYFSIGGILKIKSKLNTDDISGLRNWLADNIKGLGVKEASHFLRNIGFGKDLAILDRHVLKSLKKFKVISEIPKTLTKQKYLEIEKKLQKFSEKIRIPMAELDLLFWSEETGRIFK